MPPLTSPHTTRKTPCTRLHPRQGPSFRGICFLGLWRQQHVRVEGNSLLGVLQGGQERLMERKGVRWGEKLAQSPLSLTHCSLEQANPAFCLNSVTPNHVGGAHGSSSSRMGNPYSRPGELGEHQRCSWPLEKPIQILARKNARELSPLPAWPIDPVGWRGGSG